MPLGRAAALTGGRRICRIGIDCGAVIDRRGKGISVAIEMSSIVRQSGGQVSAEIDDEVVMMNVEQGNYYALDEVGSRIWALIEQPMEVSALCDRLIEEYEVERAACEIDVLKFLDELLEQGGVEVEGQAG